MTALRHEWKCLLMQADFRLGDEAEGKVHVGLRRRRAAVRQVEPLHRSAAMGPDGGLPESVRNRNRIVCLNRFPYLFLYV
ncbi:MAG: hypothetical protein A3F09_01695 [Chlamydiae bacterium RIFCSPHIGHO2_12_FULL_49_11]|nr:MAG: hypothetical protein A3F09_01695 [Chlamydiae bacterium RIFCSPHIGHO2_12_FULL_49_11]